MAILIDPLGECRWGPPCLEPGHCFGRWVAALATTVAVAVSTTAEGATGAMTIGILLVLFCNPLQCSARVLTIVVSRRSDC